MAVPGYSTVTYIGVTYIGVTYIGHLYRGHLYRWVDEVSYQTLLHVLELRGTREEVTGLIVDHILEMPLELLAMVNASRADALGHVAALMVRLNDVDLDNDIAVGQDS